MEDEDEIIEGKASKFDRLTDEEFIALKPENVTLGNALSVNIQ